MGLLNTAVQKGCMPCPGRKSSNQTPHKEYWTIWEPPWANNCGYVETPKIVYFSLVVDGFDARYTNKDSALHSKRALEMEYSVTT